MAMMCVNGARECNACMACCDGGDDPIMCDIWSDPIYEGDAYYDFDGDIVSEDNLDNYLRLSDYRKVCHADCD